MSAREAPGGSPITLPATGAVTGSGTSWPSLDGIVLLIADRVAERVAERLASAQVDSSASPWLTAAEAVEYLRLPSLSALHRLTAARAIPHVKQGGRLLFHRVRLDEWLSEEHYAGPPPRLRSVARAS